MKNWKKVLYSVLGIVTFLSVAICFRKPEGRTGEDEDDFLYSEESMEEAVIHYYIWENEEAYVRSVIEAYESMHHNITIELHVVNGDVYDDRLVDTLRGEEPVDLVEIRDTSQLVNLANQELIMDMTSFMQKGNLDVKAYGNMFNEVCIDGRYYGVPIRSTCWILLYNKDIFDKMGISYPGQMTWEEYGDLAIRLTRKEDGIKGGYWPPWCYNFAALQGSEYLIDDELNLTRKSLEMLHRFYEEDGSHYNFDETIHQAKKLSDLFREGNIAMMPQGEWMVNMLLEREKTEGKTVNWGIAPMPVLSEEAGTTWGQYQFAAVAQKTEHPVEVFNFLEFLCGEEGARIYAQKGIVHAYTTKEIQVLYAKAIGEEAASVISSAKRNQEQLAIPHYHELIDLFEECAENYLNGNYTIEQTMKNFKEEREKIYRIVK